MPVNEIITEAGGLISAGWTAKKVLGPSLDAIGDDFAKLYSKGRDKIIGAAARKIANIEDGKNANLRVTRDVLWNGSFSEEQICAEYFGGILAASRSANGSDDSAIQFVDVTKSLSSKQLHLHYAIYHSLNKHLVNTKDYVNVGQGSEFQARLLFFPRQDIEAELGLFPELDLNVLYRSGLIQQYKLHFDAVVQDLTFPYLSVHPTTFGAALYAVAHNRKNRWRAFSNEDFGEFPAVHAPTRFADNLEELKHMCGVIAPPPT